MNRDNITPYLYILLSALFILGSANIQAQSETKHEVVLVMSNSQSILVSDPDKLARVAALEFIESLDNNVKFGLIYFDGNATIASPLTTLGESRKTVLTHIGQLEAGTKQSNSPEAMQKAFEMLSNSDDTNPATQKSIIFLSDQPVNTGDTTQDQEKQRWLTNNFSSAAAQKGIKIFAISLTSSADQTLSETLASNTNGQFYMANNPQELLGIFRKVSTQITGQTISISPTQGISINTLTEYDASLSPIPEEESAVQEINQESIHEQNILPSWSIALVIGLLIAGLLFLTRFKESDNPDSSSIDVRPMPPVTPSIPEAYLEDIHHITLRKHLALGSSATILGRVAGNRLSEFHYIEIDQQTISREHAIIEYRDDAFYINDKNSTNGTFVNDQKVSQWQRLNHLDKVRLDKYEFIFTIPSMQVDADDSKYASPEALLEDATIINTQPPIKKPASTSNPQQQQKHAPLQEDDEDAPTVFMAMPKKRTSPPTDTHKEEESIDNDQTIFLKKTPNQNHEEK